MASKKKVPALYKAEVTMTVNIEDTVTGAWHQVVMTTMRHKGATTRVFTIDGTDHAEWVRDGLVPGSGGRMEYATHPQRAAFVNSLHNLFDTWPHGEVDG